MIRLTDEAINRINIALSEIDPHSGVYLERDCFGDTRIINHDHHVCELNALWYLSKRLQDLVGVIKDEVGIYEEV